jgi:hypothetical protein
MDGRRIGKNPTAGPLFVGLAACFRRTRSSCCSTGFEPPSASRLGDAVVDPEVDFLVIDRPPEPCDEDVVAPRFLAIHVDRDALVGQHAGESCAGELRAPVGVEDVGLAVPGDRFLDGFGTEVDRHVDRQPPIHVPSAESVEHHGQVDEAARHRDIGDVHRPHLVRLVDRQAKQKVGADLVAWVWLSRGSAADRAA